MKPSLPGDCSIPGVSFQLVEAQQNSYYMIRSESSLRTLNSSMWGGGLSSHRLLMNRQVDKSYMCEDPLTEMHEFMKEKDIPAEYTAAMLTAARVQDFGYSEYGSDFGLTVCAWATVGLSNKARAGRELRQEQLYPGTINIIVLVDGELTDAALVNSVITATEAKAAAMQDLGVNLGTVPDAAATGTTTDAVLIAATQRGPAFRYAGTSTELGYRIGRTVYASIAASTEAYRRWQAAGTS